MKYSQRLSRAVQFAIETHEIYQKQKRKSRDVAYIVHPLTVGLIAARAGADDDVVIAALLHDTVEDSCDDHRITGSKISYHFGDAVAELVMSVTEEKVAVGEGGVVSRVPWHVAKQAALERISQYSHDSVLVKSSDVISNTTDLVTDYHCVGISLFERFGGSAREVVEHYQKVIDALLARWPESPLAPNLKKQAYELEVLAGEIG